MEVFSIVLLHQGACGCVLSSSPGWIPYVAARPHCIRDNVEYIDNHDSLNKVELDGKIDILFIDTEHNGIRCRDEFNLYRNDMAPGSIILFDDYCNRPYYSDIVEKYIKPANLHGRMAEFHPKNISVNEWIIDDLLKYSVNQD